MKNTTVFLFAIASIFILSCSGHKKEGKTVEDVKSAFLLKKQPVEKIIKRPAELVPYERAEIKAKVKGYVNKVLVDFGDKVKTGQVLAILEAPEVAAESSEAAASFQKANAQYMASLDRYQRLEKASKEQGVIAEGELSNAKNQMLADSAAISSAKSSARAYSQIQNYLTIRAPFNGVITKRTIDPGDFVGGSAESSLFTLERTNLLRIQVHIPETYVNSIPSENGLTFSTSAVLDTSFTAKKLSRRSGSIDPGTRTELWEYEFENGNDQLKPGMYATAELKLSRKASSFVVPYTAVVTSMEKQFVVRVVNGKAEWVDVTEGISMDDGIEIFGNLKEGETLLVRGTDEIKPGTELQISIDQKS